MTIKANLHRLNLGCGPHYAEGWVNVDLHTQERIPDGRRVDLVADMRDGLPLHDHSCSRVYMGHVLEHLSLAEGVPSALGEVRRLLAPDGRLMVVGPDIERARAGWPSMVEMIEPKPGDEQAPPGIRHLWVPSEQSTLEAVRQVFKRAVAMDVGEVTSDWPIVDQSGWQFAIWSDV